MSSKHQNNNKRTRRKIRFTDIIYIVVAIYLTLGFATFFNSVFQESNSEVFILMTLPLLMGSLLLNNKNLDIQGYLFLLSSILMFVSFFLMLSSTGTILVYLAIVSIWGGAFIFLINLLYLWDKVLVELRRKLEIF